MGLLDNPETGNGGVNPEYSTPTFYNPTKLIIPNTTSQDLLPLPPAEFYRHSYHSDLVTLVNAPLYITGDSALDNGTYALFKDNFRDHYIVNVETGVKTKLFDGYPYYEVNGDQFKVTIYNNKVFMIRRKYYTYTTERVIEVFDTNTIGYALNMLTRHRASDVLTALGITWNGGGYVNNVPQILDAGGGYEERLALPTTDSGIVFIIKYPVYPYNARVAILFDGTTFRVLSGPVNETTDTFSNTNITVHTPYRIAYQDIATHSQFSNVCFLRNAYNTVNLPLYSGMFISKLTINPASVTKKDSVAVTTGDFAWANSNEKINPQSDNECIIDNSMAAQIAKDTGTAYMTHTGLYTNPDVYSIADADNSFLVKKGSKYYAWVQEGPYDYYNLKEAIMPGVITDDFTVGTSILTPTNIENYISHTYDVFNTTRDESGRRLMVYVDGPLTTGVGDLCFYWL